MVEVDLLADSVGRSLSEVDTAAYLLARLCEGLSGQLKVQIDVNKCVCTYGMFQSVCVCVCRMAEIAMPGKHANQGAT